MLNQTFGCSSSAHINRTFSFHTKNETCIDDRIMTTNTRNNDIPKEHKEFTTPLKTPNPSLLQQMMDLLMAGGRLQLSFEDLTGICTEIEDLRLPAPYHWHTGNLCRLAKYGVHPKFFMGCRMNKRAVNRVVAHKKAPIVGQCHLGLTDIAYPVILNNVLLGVFYYGSAVAHGTRNKGRERIQRYSKRMGINPEQILSAFDETPRLTKEDMATARQRVQLIADVIKRIVDASGLPLQQYKAASAQWLMEEQRSRPAAVRRALWHIAHDMEHAITVQEMAAKMNCHPDYLSRVFKKSVGMSLHDFILRTRLDRAQRLLRNSTLDIGQIGMQTGFRNHSHFTKVFRLHSGSTPSEYREACLKKQAHTNRAHRGALTRLAG